MNRHLLAGHSVALLTVFVWGITFVSTKILLRAFSPLEILILRFFFGWVALWVISPVWLGWQKKQEILFALSGLTGVTLYFLLENMALVYTNVANVSLIVTLAPLFTAILAKFFISEASLSRNFFTGFMLAITGIFLVASKGFNLNLNPAGDLLALLAAIAWAFYSVFIKKLTLAGYGSVIATRRIFFYGLLFMLPCVCVNSVHITVDRLLDVQNLCNLLFLGVCASALCFATWTFAIKRLGAASASAYIYLVPVISIATAHIILQEKLSASSMLGCFLTICGLVVAENRFFYKKANGLH